MIRFTRIFRKHMLLGLLFSEPLLFVALILAIIVALTFHEFSHAAVANALGDKTAERMGRMSLNPLVHLDPVGFLMLLMAGFGYARPVPYNPSNLRNRRRDPVLIGMAGPASNVLMAVIFAYALKFFAPSLGPSNLLIQFLFFAAFININLAVFNMLPVPPLDGSKVLLALLQGHKWTRLRHTLVTQGPFILIILILIDAFGGVGIFSRLFQAFGGGFFRLLGISI
jgi:Zn-dependent protease